MEYIELYNDFKTKYDANTITAQDVGELIMKLTSYFCNYNLELAAETIRFNKIAAEIQGQFDETTNKGITSSKAEVLSRATVESADKIRAEAHVRNLDVMIQSSKKLQEGLSKEYSNS
jgi:hypothetical protein